MSHLDRQRWHYTLRKRGCTYFQVLHQMADVVILLQDSPRGLELSECKGTAESAARTRQQGLSHAMRTRFSNVFGKRPQLPQRSVGHHI